MTFALFLIVTALGFDFTNGFHDSAKCHGHVRCNRRIAPPYGRTHRGNIQLAAGWFRLAQTISGSVIAFAHGTSDGQRTMGVITVVLITGGYQAAGAGPQTWVIATAGLAIGLGTYSGGWRIMRTMGIGRVDLRSPQGFAAETTSAAAFLARADGLRALDDPRCAPEL